MPPGTASALVDPGMLGYARGHADSAMICSSCGTENRGGRKFCSSCGAALAIACPRCGAANEPETGSAASAGTRSLRRPPELRHQRSHAPAAVAERKLVSVLFADLVGFTALSESRDPEEVRDLLSRYFETARTLIERYGGTVEKFIGDAVMAVWGAPVTHEDDAERAVRAGLELVAAVTAPRRRRRGGRLPRARESPPVRRP